MSKPYFFINPVDWMPMSFETLEQAEEAAKTYIGREDSHGDDVEIVVICKWQEITRVVKGPDGSPVVIEGLGCPAR